MDGDTKGITIASVVLPGNKVITRNNLTQKKSKMGVKILGVEFLSWHAEMRIISYLMRNSYFRVLIDKQGELHMSIVRHTRTGDLANSSRPCYKCQTVMRKFKQKYLPNVKFIVHFHEEGSWYSLLF